MRNKKWLLSLVSAGTFALAGCGGQPVDQTGQELGRIPNIPVVPLWPPPPILDTNFAPRPSAAGACGGSVAIENDQPVFEWMPMVSPTYQQEGDLTGVAGTAIFNDQEAGGISDADNPFLHPFGNDFEYYIAPDSRYLTQLNPNNLLTGAKTDDLYKAAINKANDTYHLGASGVLGVEMDSELVPYLYQPHDGDRVAVFGRWIEDCGHDDFHSEIHPPLLTVSAQGIVQPDAEETNVHLFARPYEIDQTFGDGGVRQHLINEFEKVSELRSTRVEAHPRIFAKPFSGVQIMQFVVRPPTPRKNPYDRLMMTGHITLRPGVAVQAYDAGNDTVGVIVVMNEAAYTPASLPTRHDRSIDVETLPDEAKKIIHIIEFASLGIPPYGGWVDYVIGRGILTDTYDAPPASSPTDNTWMPYSDVTSLPNPTPVSVDTNQVYPIYGWLSLVWQRNTRPIVNPGPILAK